MKVSITKKQSIIRIFVDEGVSPLIAFWLGKRIKELEDKTGYTFYLIEGVLPPGDMGFFGTKVIEQKGRNESDIVEYILLWIEELIKKQKL